MLQTIYKCVLRTCLSYVKDFSVVDKSLSFYALIIYFLLFGVAFFRWREKIKLFFLNSMENHFIWKWMAITLSRKTNPWCHRISISQKYGFIIFWNFVCALFVFAWNLYIRNKGFMGWRKVVKKISSAHETLLSQPAKMASVKKQSLSWHDLKTFKII